MLYSICKLHFSSFLLPQPYNKPISGSYPLFWVSLNLLIIKIFKIGQAILTLFENPANAANHPSSIKASMLKTPLTNVDMCTVFNLTFDSQSNNSKLAAQASLSCSITLDGIQPGVTIRFERGTILIRSPIYCPKEFTVQYLSKDGAIVQREEKRVFEYVGGGWHFQADEVVRCVREGKLESKLWGHDKSILEMTIFDEVCPIFCYRPKALSGGGIGSSTRRV